VYYSTDEYGSTNTPDTSTWYYNFWGYELGSSPAPSVT